MGRELSFHLLALGALSAAACGGKAAQSIADAPTATGGANASSIDTGGTDAGGVDAGGVDAGSTCAEPAFTTPDAGVFRAPPIGPLGSFQVTLQNHCTQTVWPAWVSSGGLDNSVVDTKLWLPMASGSNRSVTVYGGVRELGLWGRTGCSFDSAGGGQCQTGECGGFICAQQPQRATVFVLNQGFLGGYNLGLRVEGAVCGQHECVADVHACAPASAVSDACGQTIACSDICGSAPGCCTGPASGCSERRLDNNAPDVGDLVVTFCP